jgi:hypothetical protein
MNTKHVTSLETSKQLAEAGIVIESEFWWVEDNPEDWVLVPKGWTNIEMSRPKKYPAPIATELLERLPKYLTDEDDMNWHLNISYDDYNTPYLSYQLNEMEWFNAVTADIAPNALALLLIRLTKDGLI